MIYPIDWESAGIDVGEVDLASLADGWPAEIRQECEGAYREARWSGGSPADFEQRLAAARLCLYFYKLGGEPEWATNGEFAWDSRQLRLAGERLGLI
jgi:hypothetical protein